MSKQEKQSAKTKGIKRKKRHERRTLKQLCKRPKLNSDQLLEYPQVGRNMSYNA